jgi:hypothetical protein
MGLEGRERVGGRAGAYKTREAWNDERAAKNNGVRSGRGVTEGVKSRNERRQAEDAALARGPTSGISGERSESAACRG